MASHDLDASSSDIERGEKFWNSLVVSMKFTVDRQWLKRVRKARKKPITVCVVWIPNLRK